jgi:hypothetical protein
MVCDEVQSDLRIDLESLLRRRAGRKTVTPVGEHEDVHLGLLDEDFSYWLRSRNVRRRAKRRWEGDQFQPDHERKRACPSWIP